MPGRWSSSSSYWIAKFKMSANSPALITVLATPELFEAILLKIDLRDLLFAQKVCRTWKETITTSPALQQKLFFAPIRNKDQDPFFNPLLQEVFPSFLKIERPYEDLLMSPRDLKHDEGFEDLEYRETLLREEASWRSMFPIQPPARIENILQSNNCCTGYNGTTRFKLSEETQLRQPNGAPMGLIYDIMIHLLDEDSGSSTAIEWHMFLPGLSRRAEDAASSRHPNLIRMYEAEEERRLSFRPENKITIRGYTTFCRTADKKLSQLSIRTLEGGLIFDDFDAAPY